MVLAVWIVDRDIKCAATWHKNAGWGRVLAICDKIPFNTQEFTKIVFKETLLLTAPHFVVSHDCFKGSALKIMFI